MTRPDALAAALADLDPAAGPVFAVLDGAQFDDLPRQLLLGGFVSRPLYLDRGDNNPGQVITAPHMVWLDERLEKATGRAPDAVIPALLDLVGDRPAAVFWQCPEGAEALYRHLRGINMVMIPAWAAGEDEDDGDGDGPGAGEPAPEPQTHRMVLLRHADANVMAQILPGLSAEEAARLFGPARLIVFAPDPRWAIDGQTVSWSPRPEDVAAPPGPLRLSDAALDVMGERTLKASRAKIAGYLSTTAPEYTSLLGEADLHELVLRSELSGDSIGLRSEHSHGIWAFLALITGGDTLSNPHVAAHFRSDPRDPEVVLEELYGQVLDTLGDASEDPA
jgi:hypothetical protein